MKLFKHGFRFATVGLAFLICGWTAYGTILIPPNHPVAPESFSSCTGCITLGSGIFGNGSTGPDLGFLYSADVITKDPRNPYGLDDLDFVYSFRNNATSTASIARIAPTYIYLAADAGYFTAAAFPGGTVGPDTVDRTTAETVGFNFSSFGPGEQSFELVIRTNFRPSDLALLAGGVIDVVDSNGNSTSVNAFSSVPEPSLFWPTICILGALAAYGRMRMFKALTKH